MDNLVKIIKQKKAKIRLLSKKPPKFLFRKNHKRHKNEKRLNFQVFPFLLGECGTRCLEHVVMGLEAKRRTVHDPRYHQTPKNEKRLTFSSKPFFGEKDGARTHDPRYHKPML